MPDQPEISKEKMVGTKNSQERFEPDALVQQGFILHQQGKLHEAQAIYEHLLNIQPNHFDALQLLGAVFVATRHHAQAVDIFTKALEVNPDRADIYYNQGIALKELRDWDGALLSYGKAISIKPDYVEAYYNQGNALQELQRLDEALLSYDKAISIKPDYAEAYNNRGNILRELKRLDEALVNYDKAISIQPHQVVLYYNRGNILRELKRLDEALVNYDKAISINPDHAGAHWNRSLCHLLKGDFSAGWQGYEWRWKNENASHASGNRSFTEPLWLGQEDLNNKTILLYAEQGLGDTIQFCRYATKVSKLGAKVILEVQQPLLKLLTRLEGVDEIFSRGDLLPHFDYQCPLLSLPLAFKTDLQSIPPTSRNIRADKEKITKWETLLGERTKPRVGIAWSGGTMLKNVFNRSLTLSEILPYLASNVEYVSLQKEIRDVDKTLLNQHSEIKHFGEALEDFTDTAALCELMDIVISVDTSVAHLAGTVGINTWVLLPYSPDWRWLLDSNESPWYPSMKLYRQEKKMDWDGTLDTLMSDLEKIAK